MRHKFVRKIIPVAHPICYPARVQIASHQTPVLRLRMVNNKLCPGAGAFPRTNGSLQRFLWKNSAASRKAQHVHSQATTSLRCFASSNIQNQLPNALHFIPHCNDGSNSTLSHGFPRHQTKSHTRCGDGPQTFSARPCAPCSQSGLPARSLCELDLARAYSWFSLRLSLQRRFAQFNS